MASFLWEILSRFSVLPPPWFPPLFSPRVDFSSFFPLMLIFPLSQERWLPAFPHCREGLMGKYVTVTANEGGRTGTDGSSLSPPCWDATSTADWCFSFQGWFVPVETMLGRYFHCWLVFFLPGMVWHFGATTLLGFYFYWYVSYEDSFWTLLTCSTPTAGEVQNVPAC